MKYSAKDSFGQRNTESSEGLDSWVDEASRYGVSIMNCGMNVHLSTFRAAVRAHSAGLYIIVHSPEYKKYIFLDPPIYLRSGLVREGRQSIQSRPTLPIK